MVKKTPSKSKQQAVTVGFVSLGCAKNLVDLQVMASALYVAGYDIGVDPSEADVVLVNTCAFIEDAREEAVSAILGACEYKKSGNCRAVVVTGCLPQRYRERVLDACPDVDAIVGVDDIQDIAQVIEKALHREDEKQILAIRSKVPTGLFVSQLPELALTDGLYAYIKIAEGCQHGCAFCAIPGIRGRLRSRTMESVVEEAKKLLEVGYRELNLVAQDVTSYGRDLKDGTNLVGLLKQLDALPGDFWIRLLYGHPAMVTDELLEFIAKSRHVCHYLDIPIQHTHPDILKAMHRADTVSVVPEMVERIRAKVPGVTIRTTCLVGFPGETEAQFKHLMSSVGTMCFEHLGAFAFSPEEGTAAFALREQCDDVVAEKRRDRLMRQQKKNVKKFLDSLVGRTLRVLLEAGFETEDDAVIWRGRWEGQGPDDIDGSVQIEGAPTDVESGDFVDVRIEGYADYDLHGVYVRPSGPMESPESKE